MKGRRAAVTACPRNGATRERRTPSRCVQGSYAPERWWRGDQPWNRTTFSRASAERYDHTSSLVAWVEPTAGVEPALARYEGAVPPATLRRRWSRLEDSNPDSPVIGRTSCLLDEAWVGPAGWSRTSLVPLKRRAHGRSATTGATRRALAVGPGFEPGSFRLTAGRVAVATTLQMVGSGGLEPPRGCARGSWAADYPTTRRTSWGERPESNRLERVSQTRGAPFAFAHRRIGSR